MSSRSPSPRRSRSRSGSRSGSRSPEPVPEAEACPFLVRLYVTKGKHTPLIEFDDGKFPLADEFQVHGWKHSTPTSLIQQLFSVFPPTYRSPLARYAFKHVYVDASDRGLYRAKDLVTFSGRDFIATVGSTDTSNGMSMDRELDESAPSRGRTVEEKTLDAYGFINGDFLSVAIHVPEPRTTSIRGASARDRSDRGDRDAPPHTDKWSRGGPLPPQNWREERRPHAPAGSWRVDAAPARGGGARRPSPDLGRRSRSRSPVRRESWASRRRD